MSISSGGFIAVDLLVGRKRQIAVTFHPEPFVLENKGLDGVPLSHHPRRPKKSTAAKISAFSKNPNRLICLLLFLPYATVLFLISYYIVFSYHPCFYTTPAVFYDNYV